MIEILPSSASVVAMRVSGDISAHDVNKAIEAVETALKERERISVYAEMELSARYTLEGILRDISYGIGKLGELGRFYRAAVVTDKRWVATAARIEGMVFSQIEIRVFESTEREAAMEWAAASPPEKAKPESPTPSIEIIETTNPKVKAFQIDGRIRSQDIDRAIEALKASFEGGEKINVLGRFKRYNGFDLGAVAREDLLRLKYNALKNVDKYAIVGAPEWLRNLIELVDSMIGVDLKCFDSSEETEAWQWVGAAAA